MNTGETVGSSPIVRVSAGAGTTGADRLRRRARDAATDCRVASVGSTGVMAIEPLVAATLDGRTALFPACDPETVEGVVGSLDGGELPTDGATTVIEHDPDTTGFPVPESGALAVGDRRVLGACGWVEPTSEADYRARATPLADGGPGESNTAGLETLAADSGVRGRGRGDGARDRSVADVWRTARKADGDPVVVVSANEADPRVNADSLLLASDPFAVLDTAVALAEVVGATDVVVSVNETDEDALETTRDAADSVAAFGGHDVAVDVVVGPDEYRAGEPTMALESLEGNDRIEARRTPPGPESYGLFGRPTVIHTPRTLAQLRQFAVDGDLPGVKSDPGTRLVEVSGDVDAPTVVEVATSTDLSTAVEGVAPGGAQKTACVGGVFGGLTDSLDVPASASGLTAAGLGTNGAVELLGEDQCPVALAGRRARFARQENCGRCVPCREGSKQLTDLLRDSYDDESAIGGARELARVMERSSLCAFGRDAARPVLSALEEFESAFLAHARGHCPSGECTRGDPTAAGYTEGNA